MSSSELLDASGERLWYAVSRDFNFFNIPVINSDTTGDITIYDQSGSIVYDGNGDGVAAVIIAPGPPIARDENNNGDYEYRQVRVTGADQTDPRNYLDTFNNFDNSVFTNDESDTDDDGFIPGPVYETDPASAAFNTIVVNDQIIVITAREVIEMAEKATLQAYRNAIADYQQKVFAGVVGNYRYPWLNSYADITDLDVYNIVPGARVGRVPFLNYYQDSDSVHQLITDIVIDYDIDLVLADPADGNPAYIGVFDDIFAPPFPSTLTLDISNALLSFKKETIDLVADNSTDNVGTMIIGSDGATVFNPATITQTFYFWDGNGTPLVQDGWELCPVNLGDERDCARDDNPPYNFEAWSGDWSNHADSRIRRITLDFVFDNPGLSPDLELGFDYGLFPGGPPVYTAPTGVANATFTWTGLEAAIYAGGPPPPNGLFVDVNGIQPDAKDFFDTVVAVCEQDDVVGTEYNVASLGNANVASVDCVAALTASMDITSLVVNQLDITADYFPELPLWVGTDNWDDAMMMTYAAAYEPGAATPCTVAVDCLQVINTAGTPNDDKFSVLVLAGQHVWIPDGVPDYSDDLDDIFEGDNNNADDTLDARIVGGNDRILVIGEL